MPGRAASGGALAPEPATRRRGRTRALQIVARSFPPYFVHFLRNQTSPHFEIRLQCCRSFFAKETLITSHFCGKWPIKIRHPKNVRFENRTSHDSTPPCITIGHPMRILSGSCEIRWWLTLLQHTAATHYCNTLILQHTTAAHSCNTLLHQITATLYGASIANFNRISELRLMSYFCSSLALNFGRFGPVAPKNLEFFLSDRLIISGR